MLHCCENVTNQNWRLQVFSRQSLGAKRQDTIESSNTTYQQRIGKYVLPDSVDAAFNRGIETKVDNNAHRWRRLYKRLLSGRYKTACTASIQFFWRLEVSVNTSNSIEMDSSPV